MACPVLIVPGIGFCKIYNGDAQITAWPPALQPEDFMKKMTVKLGMMALRRKDAGFSDMIAETVGNVLSEFRADETGTQCNEALFARPVYAVGSVPDEEKEALFRLLPLQELCASVGDENVFVFPYNFTDDPLVNGEKLAEAVSCVCSECGCAQISLLAVGSGSSVVTAYLANENAKKQLAKLVFCFSPLDGSLLVSDLILDSFDYRKSASFLSTVMTSQDFDMFLELNAMIPGLLDVVFEKMFTEVRDLFMNLPAAWALCPSDDYADLADEFLEDKPQLRARTDAFHALRENLPATLRALLDGGTQLHILAGSALPFIPLSQSSDVVSDTLVNTSSAALNPSIVETGDPRGYAINTEAAYFPAQTRYFPGIAHMQALKTPEVAQTITQILIQ